MPIPPSRPQAICSRIACPLLLVLLVLLALPLAARAQVGRVHIVEPGDTLSEIAAAYGTDVATLRSLNGITGNLIRIGQELIVSGSPAVPQGGGSGQSYTVQKGDNLSRIAQRFGVSMDAILRANSIANPRLIVVGQVLRIPAPGESAGPSTAPTTGKWIDVDLSAQRVIAYEGDGLIRSFRVSTGLPGTPTVTGTFRIRLKMPTHDMRGGNRAAGTAYALEDVPWVQYFFEDYAFHGTTWHNSFGRPASRGCINMTVPDAKWLFDWAGPTYNPNGNYWQGPTAGNPGTLVVVHE